MRNLVCVVCFSSNKKALVTKGFSLSKKEEEYLCFLLILVLEFLYAASCIHEQLLASVERM